MTATVAVWGRTTVNYFPEMRVYIVALGICYPFWLKGGAAFLDPGHLILKNQPLPTTAAEHVESSSSSPASRQWELRAQRQARVFLPDLSQVWSFSLLNTIRWLWLSSSLYHPSSGSNPVPHLGSTTTWEGTLFMCCDGPQAPTPVTRILVHSRGNQNH